MRNPFRAASLSVVGNLNRDVKLQGVLGSPALLRDGETSVSGISETVGGGGANSACAAAALGAQVHFIGKVGADALGDQLRRTMERHGVRTTLARSKDCRTGTSVALGLASGNRHFLSCLPNNASLRFEDLDLRGLKSSGHLLRADVWFSKQMLKEGNQQLLSQARQTGLKTSLDINFDPAWSSGSQGDIRQRKRLLRKILPLVDIAHGNVRELKEFTDSPDLSTALSRLSKWGVGSVVVHLGVDGAGFYCDNKLIVEPANKARRTIHSTGTGDVLSICMILLASNDQLSIRQKLRLANRTVREFMEGRRRLIPEL
jgi:sugar/nucleoside kinase (ribokinase family)